jgi:hypothetical protein
VPKSGPPVVYIETSILEKLSSVRSSPDFDSPAFLQLKNLCQNLRLPIFTTRLCVDEITQHHKVNVEEAISKVKILSRYPSSGLDKGWPKDEAAILNEAEQKILHDIQEQGINVLDNVQADQARLIEMAVKKLRPFEAKGEKGFKDTIILFTIINHERQREVGGHGLILTEDKVFAQAIDQVPECQGLDIIVKSSILDAIEYLKDFLTGVLRADLERRASTLLKFLNQHLDMIEVFIRRRVSFDRFTLALELSPLYNVDALEAIDLLEIQTPFPGFLQDNAREGRVKLSFSAKVRLTLAVREFAVPPFQTLRLKGEEQPEERPIFGFAGLLRNDGPLFKREIEQIVTVQASARITRKDPEDQYSELILEGVS